jgi:hypothetical protein
MKREERIRLRKEGSFLPLFADRGIMSGADLAEATLGRVLLCFNSVIQIIELEFCLF